MSQKQENLLQLALQMPEEARQQTENLNVGYNASEDIWELIVKYHGELRLPEERGISVEVLIGGYAILRVPAGQVDFVTGLEQIEYVEMPKRYYYDEINPAEAACILQLQRRDLSLSGEGVLVAVLDSGINYRLPEFRNRDGSTRIRYLWDQTLESDGSPEGFHLGREFDGEEINEALQREESMQLPTIDGTGHGTAVASIGAGSKGVAYGAELLVVKLGMASSFSFPRTTEIMRAVTWALRKASKLGRPLVINLSIGNSYGSHAGDSLIERFLDNAAEIGRTVICIGSGNEAAQGGHIQGRLKTGERQEVELAVAGYQRSFSLQLWKHYSDHFLVWLRAPRGAEQELLPAVNGGKYEYRLAGVTLYVFYGEPKPYSLAQEIVMEWIPEEEGYVPEGIWTIGVEAVDSVSGNYYMYLPSAEGRSRGTLFYGANPELTLTIPSTAARSITVGAYDSRYDAYADFSGRGGDGGRFAAGMGASGNVKPDLVAPGVGILGVTPWGEYRGFTGTSFATPIVAGSAALLMEWGIVRGNDPYLYGEKLKAYLQKGAKPLRGEGVYPNSRVGWGKLCVEAALPVVH